jgi:hypothetical protein
MNRLKKTFKYTMMMGTMAAFTTACSSDDYSDTRTCRQTASFRYQV